MSAEELPREVRDLIQWCLPSLDHVEVLLLLHAHSSREFRIGHVAHATRLDELTAASVLEGLADAGLVTADDKRYRFKPSLQNTGRVEHLRRPITCFPSHSCKRFSRGEHR